jgi:hypothetical protein
MEAAIPRPRRRGRAGTSRMRVTAAGSATNAMMRISPPQRGHTSTSTANTRRSSSAQHRRRAASAGHGSASRSVARLSSRAAPPAAHLRASLGERHKKRARRISEPL